MAEAVTVDAVLTSRSSLGREAHLDGMMSDPGAQPARPPAYPAVELVADRGFARFVERRLDPRTVTGLALSIASVAVVVGGFVLGFLALVVRTHNTLVDSTRRSRRGDAPAQTLSSSTSSTR